MKIHKILSKMSVDTDCVKFSFHYSNKIEKTPVMTVRDARNKYNQEFYYLKVKAIRPIHDELELPDFQDYIEIIIDNSGVRI